MKFTRGKCVPFQNLNTEKLPQKKLPPESSIPEGNFQFFKDNFI